jgi:Protein of unknown function (DUF3383)
MSGLSVSNLVSVTVSLTPSGAQPLSFGVLMIAGDSAVINGVQRLRTYTNFDSVETDFGSTAPETIAASLYFGQSPQPSTCQVGRWFSTAAPAENDGGILSPSQQTLALWTSITNGGFDITVDGVSYTLTGLNFTAATNLNGVASIINTALSGVSSTAICTWNGSFFVITSGTSGTGTQASGTITFGSAGTANDTLTLNGQTITFVASSPTANEVLIGTSATNTAANLLNFLLGSSDPDLVSATYTRTGAVVTVSYKTVGTTGNSFSMTKSSTAITLSGSDLAGGTAPSSVGYATAGTGTDISTMLQLTAATSQVLVPGFAAETPAQCAAALAVASTQWYGLMFAATQTITDQENLDVCTFIEAQDITRVFGVTIQNTNALSSVVSNDLGSIMMAAGYNQSFSQYSSTSPYAVASFFGRNFSINFQGSNTTITVMYKQEPSVIAETLTPAQAQTLQAKNINVFVNYVNNTSIIQYGVMASGQFFDTIQNTDWLQNAIQTAVYNVLYTTTTKVPQTDAGVNQITNAIASVCGQGVANGMIAPGTWNGPAFGSIVTGQFLKQGYYIYAQPVALQSEAARATRVCPPIQVAVKLAGAIQTVDILVTVNE